MHVPRCDRYTFIYKMQETLMLASESDQRRGFLFNITHIHIFLCAKRAHVHVSSRTHYKCV